VHDSGWQTTSPRLDSLCKSTGCTKKGSGQLCRRAAYRRLEKPMEARGTNTIFMPPLRCSVLSSVWRSNAALRPPDASASLKRDAITATTAATCVPAAPPVSAWFKNPQHASVPLPCTMHHCLADLTSEKSNI
jgi:hypothetical protein